MFVRSRFVVVTAIVVIVLTAAQASADDDLTKLKPGDKVLVEVAGRETLGEFVEYVGSGILKVRVPGPTGREQTRLVPVKKVHLPGPNAGAATKPGPRGPSGRTANRAMNDRTPPSRDRQRAMDKPAGADKSLASKKSANQSAPPADEALAGRWRRLPRIADGNEVPGTGGILVFQEDRLLLANMSGSYRVDPTQDPKHLDFSLGADNLDVPYRGLYELAGNTLRICFCTTAGGPRPKSFPAASDDGVELIVCERSGNVPKSSGPASAPAQLDPGLKELIVEMIKLLEADRAEAFLERAAAPDVLAKMKEAKQFDEVVKGIGAMKPMFLAVLPKLLELTPEMKANGTEAVFDLSALEIKGLPKNDMVFRKVGERWYLPD